MKKLVSIIGVLALVGMFLGSSMVFADPYEAKPHDWRNAHTFRKAVTFKGDVTVEGTLSSSQFSEVFYVDSGSGADTPIYGATWEKPFATINYAMERCTADRGDVVIALPGHNVGITTAAEIDLDVAGVFLIGVGTGTLMPTIDFDAAAASVAIGANNVTVSGIRFRTSFNAVTVGLDIEDGVCDAHVIGCQFGFAETSTDEFAIALRTGDASNYAAIEDCQFRAGAQAAVTAITFVKDTDGTIVRNSWITGTYSTAPILGATTASTNLLITGNQFFTAGTADTFNLVAASTGIVSQNLIVMNAANAAAALDIGNCVSIDNYLIADDDVTGAKASIEASAFASVTATADDA